MKCFEQKSNVMSEKEGDEFYQKELTKLEKAIYNYMANIQYASNFSDKEMIRITKRDSNYIIKEWVNA
tara:strand:+ start:305 stop:508 length:204 start_codon:yes stop_codon:yes gene_type:complete